MAETSTSWAKGSTGNSVGRPTAMRTALRRALHRSGPPPEPMSRLDQWCEDLIARSITPDARIAVLQFIEGNRSLSDLESRS